MASHPSRVRGLKLRKFLHFYRVLLSHPSRVRGLKYYKTINQEVCYVVAPFTGAWIEIVLAISGLVIRESHPSRVRGLK